MRFEFWSLIIISEQHKEGFTYIKKSFWLGLSHFHTVEISVCPVWSVDPDGGVSRYRYVSVRALQPLE